MQVGIIGSTVLGHWVSVPVGCVWSWPALGTLSLVLAVVVVCTGVFTDGLFDTDNLALLCAVALPNSLLSLENPKGLLDEIND